MARRSPWPSGAPAPVPGIAAPAASRLDLLADATARPRRHRTLRTAIGWSHELCTPLERLLWARLTPLRTDFDAAVAREVSPGARFAGDDVDRALQGLVAQSVVQRDGDRYRMLDTLREYGRMWLAELGEARAAADRHAAGFLGLARRAHDGWTGPDQVSWYHRVADTHLDLCAALEHLLAHDVTAAQEMAGRVGFFWACCGHLSEARNYAQRAWTPPGRRAPPDQAAVGFLGVALLQGDLATAEKYGALCTAVALYDRDHEGMLRRDVPLRPHPADDGGAGRRAGGGPARPAHGRQRPGGLRPPAALPPSSPSSRSPRSASSRVRGGGHRAAPCLRAHRRALDPLLADYQLALIALLPGPPGRLRRARPGRCSRASTATATASASRWAWTCWPPPSAARGAGERAARVYGTGHAYWRMVGHPQRGTPELGPIRETCEIQARAAVGDEAYPASLRARADGQRGGRPGGGAAHRPLRRVRRIATGSPASRAPRTTAYPRVGVRLGIPK
ncbi:regulator [Streptomyces californicus]